MLLQSVISNFVWWISAKLTLLTYFAPLVSFCNPWKHWENQKFCDMAHRRRLLEWNCLYVTEWCHCVLLYYFNFVLHFLIRICFPCQSYFNSRSFYFSFTRTFAYYTIRDRLPDILTKVIDEFSRKASDHHRNETEVSFFLRDIFNKSRTWAF